MKRRFVLVSILILLFFLFGNATAEESEKEILFRGNSWGSTMDEVKSSFPDNIIWLSPKPDSSYSIMDHMIGTHKKYYDGHVCCYVTALSSSLENLKVAGYGVEYVQMRFAYVPTSEGYITDDPNNTALYYAEYRLNCIDFETAFEDLKSKLDDLYGNISVKSYPKYSYTETYYTWHGAEGTMVTLKSKFAASGMEIYIMYGFNGADDLLNKAYGALAFQESIDSESNYDGL